MSQKLFNIYFFLFILVMINREFTPFGVEIRYICSFISIILLINFFISRRRIKINSMTKKITIFFAIMFISNIMWLFNSFDINKTGFFVILISYIFNFMSYLIFVLYSDDIDIDKYKRNLFISLVFLIISMFYCIFIGDLNQTPLSTYTGRVADLSSNFFGGIYRISGFAQDPNYTSLFLIIGIITFIYFYKKEHKIFVIVFTAILTVFYCFAASKTTLVALFIAIIYLFISKRIKKVTDFVIISLIFIIPIAIVFFNIPLFENNLSMKQRFAFWSFAKELFFKNPIIGNGLTSFRSYFSISGWYVQCHSTIFQILSENGIICLLLFANILYNNLKGNNKYVSIITIIYSIFMINTETLYHIYSIFIIGIIPIIITGVNNNEREHGNNEKDTVIFLINSLCNGGAERVVANMANEFSKENEVYIITLYNEKTYKLDSKINIISLYNKKLSKLEKIYKIPFIVNKVNRIIKDIEKSNTIKLITSHLIYSNLISKLSKYKNSTINVIHVSYKVYDTKFHYFFKKGLQFLYNNTPIVTVSKGCENELLSMYNIKPQYIDTIYNPLNIDEIKRLSEEKCDINEPFILFTGRLDKPKRPELLIDIFYKGEFYKKYKLCMLGVGPYEELLKDKVREYEIDDRVIFEGWQTNVFRYMKNAKLFVNSSKNEAFPMTIIEALACNCPVVSFDIDYGPNEILVNDLRGYLAEDGNINSMIDVMSKALNDYPKNLISYIEEFDVKVVNNKYLELYNR